MSPRRSSYVIRSHRRRDRCVKTLAAALDPHNYKMLPPVTDEKRHELTVTGDKDWGTKTRQVIWTNKPPPPRRLGPENIMTKPRTLSREAQMAEKPIEFWELFFTSKMLDLIVEHTNEKIQAEIDDRRHETGSEEFLKKSPHLKIVDKVKYFILKSLVTTGLLLLMFKLINNNKFVDLNKENVEDSDFYPLCGAVSLKYLYVLYCIVLHVGSH